jgi:hypothetical protein
MVERVVEERKVDGHRVVILEDVAEEGTGFFLIIDDVLADEVEPLGHVPSDQEIRAVMRRQGLR